MHSVAWSGSFICFLSEIKLGVHWKINYNALFRETSRNSFLHITALWFIIYIYIYIKTLLHTLWKFANGVEMISVFKVLYICHFYFFGADLVHFHVKHYLYFLLQIITCFVWFFLRTPSKNILQSAYAKHFTTILFEDVSTCYIIC